MVTATYGPDAALCAQLNRSLGEFFPACTHYILVDRRDLGLVRPLEGPRTRVLAKEEVLPRGFVRAPVGRRWVCPWTLRPLRGWLVQQVAKFASTLLVDEQVVVHVDSDTAFVRDVDVDSFVRDDRTRMYRLPEGITPTMTRHVEWHRNACRMLGVEPDTPPMADYISTIVSWDRAIVRRLCDRVEQVTGRHWYQAVARTPQFSEGLLYGAFVDKVLGRAAPVMVDERDRCLSYWDTVPISPSQSEGLADQFVEGDWAVMISSHSGTPVSVRREILTRVTGGRLEA